MNDTTRFNAYGRTDAANLRRQSVAKCETVDEAHVLADLAAQRGDSEMADYWRGFAAEIESWSRS